jgi:hypothetical protein
MSNRKKLAQGSQRAPQHRQGHGRHREPTRTIGDLLSMPGQAGAKIVAAGVAGATLVIPATAAYASGATAAGGTTAELVALPAAAQAPGTNGAQVPATTAVQAASANGAQPQSMNGAAAASQQGSQWDPIPTTGAKGEPGVVIRNPYPVLPGLSPVLPGNPPFQPLSPSGFGPGSSQLGVFIPAPAQVPPQPGVPSVPQSAIIKSLLPLSGGFTPNFNVYNLPEQMQQGPVINAVVLGESWASGNGSNPKNFFYSAPIYDGEGNLVIPPLIDPSRQSSSAPALQALAQVMAVYPDMQVNLTDAAHTGATYPKMTAATDVGSLFPRECQLCAVPGNNLVLIQTGGDDAHVAPLITNMLNPLGNSVANFSKVQDQFASGQYGATMANLDNQIAQLAPGSSIVVTGYPQPFSSDSPASFTSSWPFTSLLIDPHGPQMANQFADLATAGNLAGMNAAAAANLSSNFIFANPQGALGNLTMFDSTAGMTGLTPWDLIASFHPTDAGNTAIANSQVPAVAEAVYNQRALQGYGGTLDVPPIDGVATFPYLWNLRVGLPLADQPLLTGAPMAGLAQQAQEGPVYTSNSAYTLNCTYTLNCVYTSNGVFTTPTNTWTALTAPVGPAAATPSGSTPWPDNPATGIQSLPQQWPAPNGAAPQQWPAPDNQTQQGPPAQSAAPPAQPPQQLNQVMPPPDGSQPPAASQQADTGQPPVAVASADATASAPAQMVTATDPTMIQPQTPAPALAPAPASAPAPGPVVSAPASAPASMPA